MFELLAVGLFCLVLGLLVGFWLGRTFGLSRAGYCPKQEHEFAHLRGAFAYCLHCPAKRRFL